MWAVGGRSSFINLRNRCERTLLRVIKVSLAWHRGGFLFEERMSGCSGDGEVGGGCVSCTRYTWLFSIDRHQ